MTERRRYDCRRTVGATLAGGTLEPGAWADIAWTADFVDIETGCDAPAARRARAKLAWNDSGLFVLAHLVDTDVSAKVTKGGPEILRDNTFELLLDPDCDGLNYYEVQINALGACWELALPKPYSAGGVADPGGRVAGMARAVTVYGMLNDSSRVDDGWEVSLALPWSGLIPFHRLRQCPPTRGDAWRINMARLQWSVEGKEYWVWSVQGELNLHAPAQWGDLVFG
ncbi:MAG: carbohydrate-binding family 9-like protein [Gammaproteobacteria bacterium]